MGFALTAPLLAATMTFLALKRRQRLSLGAPEASAILMFGLLSTLQGALQGQVQFDDRWFTGLYVALPACVAVRAGAFDAFISATLGTGLLLLVAATHPLTGLVPDGGVVQAEWITLWIVLAGIGAATDLLTRLHPLLAPLGTLVFLLFPVTWGEGLLLRPQTLGSQLVAMAAVYLMIAATSSAEAQNPEPVEALS